jgi:AcrR family transcriptional regulator
MKDPRTLKTERLLFQALARLLKEKEFDRITVSDIVKEAHVTRKTFYNHYQDKLDMVQEYQNALSERILTLQAAHAALDYDYFVDLFTLLQGKDTLLGGLLSVHGSAAVQEIIKGTMTEYCRKRIPDKNKDPLFLKYQSVMMANAIFGVVQYWLSAKPKTSPEKTARIVCGLPFLQ